MFARFFDMSVGSKYYEGECVRGWQGRVPFFFFFVVVVVFFFSLPPLPSLSFVFSSAPDDGDDGITMALS